MRSVPFFTNIGGIYYFCADTHEIIQIDRWTGWRLQLSEWFH